MVKGWTRASVVATFLLAASELDLQDPASAELLKPLHRVLDKVWMIPCHATWICLILRVEVLDSFSWSGLSVKNSFLYIFKSMPCELRCRSTWTWKRDHTETWPSHTGAVSAEAQIVSNWRCAFPESWNNVLSKDWCWQAHPLKSDCVKWWQTSTMLQAWLQSTGWMMRSAGVCWTWSVEHVPMLSFD